MFLGTFGLILGFSSLLDFSVLIIFSAWCEENSEEDFKNSFQDFSQLFSSTPENFLFFQISYLQLHNLLHLCFVILRKLEISRRIVPKCLRWIYIPCGYWMF